METNILIAIKNLINDPINSIGVSYRTANRVNSMGDALELYVKDLLCGSLHENDVQEKNRIHQKCFSCFGNQNHPPDFIVRGGDAFEVKKIQEFKSELALNSSPPKNKLHSNDIRLTEECRKCDGGDWKEKELFYVIGNVQKDVIRYLFFVQGTCYAADHDIYEKIHSPIKEGVDSVLDSLGFVKNTTVELGRVNKTDPLGITYLRIRGMWGIKNPLEVFEYVTTVDQGAEFTVNVILLTEKYLSFPLQDREQLELLVSDTFSMVISVFRNHMALKYPYGTRAKERFRMCGQLFEGQEVCILRFVQGVQNETRVCALSK